MIKYRGPRVRIVRRLGLLPGLTQKGVKYKKTTPGQHGKFLYGRSKRTSLSDDYKQRLIEKQKLRFNYGVSEKQLVSYYKEAKRRKGSTGNLLLQLLESRLDCLVYRLGFASTIPAARQLINHKHIVVNKKIVNIPSFLCQKNDLISVKNKEKSKILIQKVLDFIDQKRKAIILRSKTVLSRKLSQSSKGKKRFQRLIKKSSFRSLLPKHLSINSKKIVGKVNSAIKRSDVLVRINELKVIEYYSR